MIIKVLLASILFCCVVYGASNSNRSKSVAFSIMGFGLAGIYFVFDPEKTNSLAHYLGVGRGADLVVYCWIVISGGIVALQQFRLIMLQRDITELVRRVAIIEATDARFPTK